MVLNLLFKSKEDKGKIDYYDLIKEASLVGMSHSDLSKVAGELELPIKKQWFSRIALGQRERRARPPTPKHAFTMETITAIQDFCISDTVSRVSPNKSMVTKRASKKHGTPAESVPIYYRQHTIKELWEKFKGEHPTIKVSRSSFYKYIPKNVKKPKSQQDCCPVCKEARQHLPELKRIAGLRGSMDPNDLNAMRAYQYHAKVAKQRADDYKKELAELEEDQALITLDFKANITLGKAAEEDSHIFFNAPQRTVFGASAVFKKGGKIYKVIFTLVSAMLNHDSRNVIDMLDQHILSHGVFNHFKPKRVSFWMDNAPGHFRTKELIAGYYQLQEKHEMNFNFNFFAEYHGKSDCDRHFGLISRLYSEHALSHRAAPVTTTEEFLEMYKGAIRSYHGHVLPDVGASYAELNDVDSKKLNVVAQEFYYKGIHEFMLANSVDQIGLPCVLTEVAKKSKPAGKKKTNSENERTEGCSMPFPYVRTSFKGPKTFKFNLYYQFKFQKKRNGEPVLSACLDSTIKIKDRELFGMKLIEENKPQYCIRLGVLTSAGRKYRDLRRIVRRYQHHEEDFEGYSDSEDE